MEIILPKFRSVNRKFQISAWSRLISRVARIPPSAWTLASGYQLPHGRPPGLVRLWRTRTLSGPPGGWPAERNRDL